MQNILFLIIDMQKDSLIISQPRSLKIYVIFRKRFHRTALRQEHDM